MAGGIRPRVRFSVAFPGRQTGDFFNGARNPSQRRAKVREVDEREDQTRHPEQVDVREQGEKSKHRHDLELYLLGSVRHALGQGVQPQKQEPHGQHDDDQKNGHNNQKGVGFAGGRDEARERVWRGRVDRRCQV